MKTTFETLTVVISFFLFILNLLLWLETRKAVKSAAYANQISLFSAVWGYLKDGLSQIEKLKEKGNTKEAEFLERVGKAFLPVILNRFANKTDKAAALETVLDEMKQNLSREDAEVLSGLLVSAIEDKEPKKL